MLSSLAIRNVVLIERLDLDFGPGMSVLTGETGAGKSILLDSLGLALGVRAEARLVRHGSDQAAVTAVFEVSGDEALAAFLGDHGISAEDGSLYLRRTLGRDGRSKAFINDEPVSVAFLRDVGERLVEIHGQFESRRLLDAHAHGRFLDLFGGYGDLSEATSGAFHAWRAKADERARLAAELEEARRDEELLRHNVEELAGLDPRAGEEAELARRRSLMMHAEQLLSAMSEALAELGGQQGADERLQRAARAVEKVTDKADGRLAGVVTAIDRAIDEAAEAANLLERLSSDLDLDPAGLEAAEDRLFQLRAISRKHGVPVDDLAEFQARLATQLEAIEDGGAGLAKLEREEAEARAVYVEAAAKLTEARKSAARRLDGAVNGELADLKLERAEFTTEITALDEVAWSANGADRTRFLVATNPGAPPGPLSKIASGGEMARFMLALKVVLAEADDVPTLIFDEVDAGVGGAVAAAVGERLAKLAGSVQVLVVTHSPQVAARGASHWRVSKSGGGTSEPPTALDDGLIRTSVDPLDAGERKEEIARMLAGATVTDEARAAADSLLAGAT